MDCNPSYKDDRNSNLIPAYFIDSRIPFKTRNNGQPVPYQTTTPGIGRLSLCLRPLHHNLPCHRNLATLRNSTCQCTQCRKHTGSLTPHGITLPTSYFSPPFPANQTLKSYQVTPNSYRSFCSQCGSSLAFNEGKIGEEAEETEIYVGTLDEDVLKGEVGNILGKAKYHCWLKNAVDGVSDKFEEPMYEENMVGKEPMKKKE